MVAVGAYEHCQPPSYGVLRGGNLCSLVSELSRAFKDERARGAVLNNRQDQYSFRRLHARVQKLLQSYILENSGDWRQYAAWGDHSYLRHLLWSTDEFELMVLCWKDGQTSRVHNHADSHCWLGVLQGEVCETQYAPLRDGQEQQEEGWQHIEGLQGPSGAVFDTHENADGVCLTLTGTRVMQTGDVGYINDRIALHSVGCCARTGHDACFRSSDDGADAECAAPCSPAEPALACTLHLYCPPIRRVKAFEDGKVTECVPGFFSRHSLPAPDGCSIA